MIFGECPYCGEVITNSMPEESPAVFQNECESCHKSYWIYASRVNGCVAYTENGFRKEFILDEENGRFKRR